MTFICAAALFIYISSLCDGQIHNQSASDTEAQYLLWCILLTNKSLTVKKVSRVWASDTHWHYTELYVRPSDPLFLLYRIQHGHPQGKRHPIARWGRTDSIAWEGYPIRCSYHDGWEHVLRCATSLNLHPFSVTRYMASTEIPTISLFSGVHSSCLCAPEAAVVRHLSVCITFLLAVPGLTTGHRPLAILDLVPKLEWPCSWSPSWCSYALVYYGHWTWRL